MFKILGRAKFACAMPCTSIRFILFIFLHTFRVLAQKNGTVPVGSTMTANGAARPWFSPSGDFAFGFRQVPDNDLFLLSIWYDKIPDQTIVWFTNSIDPVPRGSTVELNAQAGLVLSDPQGRPVWSTKGIDGVDHGVMNDFGNFIIMRNNLWMWQSFEHPSDTILPLQELYPGSSVLISRQSETNFSRGRFYLRFLDNGNLVLTIRGVPTNLEDDDEYYNRRTSDNVHNGSSSGIRVFFKQNGTLHIVRRNNQTSDLIRPSTPLPPASENYYRATLNFDGVFTYYYHPRTLTGTPNWVSVGWLPDNICVRIDGDKGRGPCGYNSICSLDSYGRPICQCPNVYELVDPKDNYGGCTPKFIQSCIGGEEQGSAEDLFDFLEINNTDWPKSDFEQLKPSTENSCKQACLQDCFCAVAIFRNNSCLKKKLPLSNGRIAGDLNSKAFLKFNKNPGLHNSGQKPKPKDKGTLIIVVSVLLGSSVLINLLFIGATCCGFFLILERYRAKSHPSTDPVETNLRCFRYRELVDATNGFREEVGRGSFGIVYKGVIRMSSRTRSTVAVKKLDRVAQDAEKEFRAEVNSIGQTHHKNLVRLLGFCDEGQQRLLVYEYMSNGALSSFLFRNPKPSWSLRTQIAMGIARGLAYLHEECNTPIIHCDIKPQNILLDECYNARICDFGLAKLLVLNQSRTRTNIRGTKGYVAPEWFRSQQVTAKVDVYSFGVLLLEIISCRKCLEDVEIGGENPVLVDWAWDCFQEGRLDKMVENDLEALNDGRRLERFVMIGFWCIQEDLSVRPTMKRVSQMLEEVVEVMAPPRPWPFSTTD